MKVAARRSRRAGGDADDSEWDCSDEESPDDEEEQEEFCRVGSGWAKLKGAQEEFSHKVHRAFLNFKVHPKVSTRYQQDQAEAMEIMRKEIEMEAEALRKRKEGELRKQLRERAKPKSQPKLIRLNEREKVRLLEHFNLEDDEGLLNSIENSQKVAKLALDEVAVTLKEHEWWKVCCDPVREVLLEVEGECGSKMSAPRPLTKTESVWEGMLANQENGAWNHVRHSAHLAGTLLLFDMQQKNKFNGIRERAGTDAWTFADRFFGGVFRGTAMRRMVTNQLKPLYITHRNLVMAAVEYAIATRKQILWHSEGRKKASKFHGQESADSSVESRADALVLGFFPWCKPGQLGTQLNICGWDTFRDEITAYANVYDAMWNKRPVEPEKGTGRLRVVSDENCTWDYINTRLCRFQKVGPLKKAIKALMNLQTSYASQVAAAKKAEAAEAKAAAQRAAMAARVAAAEDSEELDSGTGSDTESDSDGSDSEDASGEEEEPAGDYRLEGAVREADEDDAEAGGLPVGASGGLGSGNGEDPAALEGGGFTPRQTRAQAQARAAPVVAGGATEAGAQSLEPESEPACEEEQAQATPEKETLEPVPAGPATRSARATRSSSAVAAAAAARSDQPDRQCIRAASLPLPKPAGPDPLPEASGRRTRARAAQERNDPPFTDPLARAADPPATESPVAAVTQEKEGADVAEAAVQMDDGPASGRGTGPAGGTKRAQKTRSEAPRKKKAPKPTVNRTSGSKRAAASSGSKGRRASKKRRKEKRRKDKGASATPAEKDGDTRGTPDAPAAVREEAQAAATAKPRESRSKARRDDTTDYTVRVLPEAVPDRQTAFSAVYPKPGTRFDNLEAHGDMPTLLHVEEAAEKAKFVCSLSKHLSGTFYSLGHVTTAPHQTHNSGYTRTIQGAAAGAGLQSMNLKGDMAFLHPDVSYLPPGTPEYTNLGLEEIVAAVTPEVLSNIIQGICAYAKHGKISEQKAKEMTGGLSRMVLNYGFGFGGHCYENGVKAALGEFANVAMMNMDSLPFFPDNGACLGVLFEALGKAQDAVVKELGLEDVERTDPERNATCAGKVGELLQKPGCQAGDCLFLTIEGADSQILQEALVRLNSKLKAGAEVTAASTSIHVDPQNPCPVESSYPRVSLMTWVVHFVVEGEAFSFQITGILCNRASLCNRKVNNESVQAIRENYAKGVSKFEAVHGQVKYEDDGLGVFSQAAPLVVAHLKDEPVVSDNKDGAKVGSWAGIQQVRPADGSSPSEDQDPQYRLVQGKTRTWSLQTVGDPELVGDRPAKAASDLASITEEGSGIPHAAMLSTQAIYNKMGQHSSERSLRRR